LVQTLENLTITALEKSSAINYDSCNNLLQLNTVSALNNQKIVKQFHDECTKSLSNSLAISSPQSKILCEKIITRNIHKESDATQCRKEIIESFNRNVKRYKALLGRQYETNSVKSVNTFWENFFEKESNCIALVPSKKRKNSTDLMTPASFVTMTKKKRKTYTKKSDKIPNNLFGAENSVSPNDYLFTNHPAT
jgi:hypothetical protein